MSFIPCEVPWVVSPSMSGLTLYHADNDGSPMCTVTFGGGRLINGSIDSRRIELCFDSASEARVGPLKQYRDHSAYIDPCDQATKVEEHAEWLDRWQMTGICPDPGFYKDSSTATYRIVGIDSFVEVRAGSFSWREWIWDCGPRDELTDLTGVAASGSES